MVEFLQNNCILNSIRLGNSLKHKPATSLAAHSVLAKMKAIVDNARPKLDPKYPDPGLLYSTGVERRKGSAIVSVTSDNEDAPMMRFTVERKNGGFYLTGLEP